MAQNHTGPPRFRLRPARFRDRLARMDLSDAIFRTRGRVSRPISGIVLRELDESDLALLQEEKGSTPSHIKRLSERHHALARNLAGGMPPGEAGIVCGYSASRVSILQDDPAFRELLHFYRADVEREYRGLHEKLAGLAHDAAEMLSERMEDEPEKLSIGQLQEIIKLGADRTGFGPQSSSTNINVNVDLAGRLQRARERVRDRQQLIEGEAL
jgi:hypothetical protein